MSSPRVYPESPLDLRRHSTAPRDGSAQRRHRVLMNLGEGGMGVVKLAMVRGPQGFVKLMVLKTLHPQLVLDAEARRQFLEEARISARLVHPNIVQVYEVTEFEGAPTIVMEYLEGQSLWTVLEECKERLPLFVHLHILSQVLAGLQAAHDLEDYEGTSLGLIHRDVSPHNVFVLYDGQVKVLDFGIAKIHGSEVQSRTGVTKGKLRYMAPEQLSGSELDCRADLFSVGVMLWEALTGERLWGELSEKEIMLRLLTNQIPPLNHPQVPDALRRTCARALAVEREHRHPSAREFRLELEEYLSTRQYENWSEALSSILRRDFEQARRITSQLIRTQVKVLSEAPPGEMLTLGDVTRRSPIETNGPNAARPLWQKLAFALGGGVLGLAVIVIAVSIGTNGAKAGAPLVGSEPTSNALTCAAGQKLCSGACVSVDRPEYGCGADSCDACRIPNATPRCNAQHMCDIAVCYQAYGDCDKNEQNGCEVSVRLDPDHCAGCGLKCPELPNAERGCGDACTIWRCSSGFSDCNGDASDGCEVKLADNTAHCGRCGHACSATETCQNGKCGP